MDTIKKRINAQLFKNQEVELSAEKVELSSIKDFEKANTKAIKSGLSAANKLESAVKSSRSALQSSLKDQEEVIKIGEQLVDKIKSLGLDTPANVERGIKGAKQWKQEIEDLIKVLAKIDV